MANKRYLDLITKGTNSRIQKMNLMDNFYNAISPDIGVGAFNRTAKPSQYNTYLNALANPNQEIPNWNPPIKGNNRVKTRQNMMDELLPVPNELDGGNTNVNASNGDTGDGTAFTTGDILGMVSTAGGAIGQVANTISAAKASKKNVNRWRGFNDKALATNAQAQVQSQENEQTARRKTERDLRLAKNTQKNRLRGMSRGVNQLRSNDMATEFQFNEAEISAFNELESIFGNELLNLMGQEQQLLSQKDQMEMSGQERTDERIQQDRDNFYTNMATNLAGMSEAGQKLGSDLNQAKYREDFLKMLPLTNRWGIGAEYEDGLYGDISLMTQDNSPYSQKTRRSITRR